MAELEKRESSGPQAGDLLMGGLKAIRKHWPILVACIVVAAGLSLVYSKSLPRIYQAQAMLEIDPSVSRPLGEKMDSVMPLGTSDYFDTREYYETQYRIVTSSRVMEAAARGAGLQRDYAYFGLQSPPEKPITVEQAGAALRGRVGVEPVKNSRLMLIKVEDTDPARATRLANAVAAAFMDQNLEKAVSATSDSVVWLNTQVDSVKQELETNENALHKFKKTNDLPSTSINESSNTTRAEMQELNTALTKARTQRAALEARHAELDKVSEQSPDELPASELLGNQYLQQLRGEYRKAVSAREDLTAAGKGQNHPSVREADQRVLTTRRALLAEIKNIKGAVESDLAIVRREEGNLASLYESAHKRAVDLNMKEIEYHRLDRSRAQNEKLYGMLIEHLKDADLARMMKVNNIHLIEPAAQPGGPIRPRTQLNVIFGILAGLVLGIALVWLRETLDSSLKTPEDVERHLETTFLGLLPAVESALGPQGRGKKKTKLGVLRNAMALSPELIVHEKPLSGLAEAARSIRTNLMFTNPDHPYKKLLVTSSAPSEGKTTVACSIAIALAQSGQRVCIIDCDLRRPRLHRIFDRKGDAGVTNVLVGDATIEEVARPTIVDNLSCIPSGPTPPNPADLLHSESFKQFLEAAAARFDRIVIDSPPLVAVTDSAIISTLVDGTVFVLRAHSTTRALAGQGMRTLADVDAPIAGAVLNAVDLTKHEYAYRHYYYYKREGYGLSSSGDRPSSPLGVSGDGDQPPTAPPAS